MVEHGIISFFIGSPKVWLLACMLLVFLSLVEYAVILRQVLVTIFNIIIINS